MALTNFAALTSEQKTVWSLDFWRQARNMSFTTKFLGDSPNAIIQRVTELKKSEKGARAVITLLADLEGDGVAGDRTLEGNEEALKSFDEVIRVDQLRHANRIQGRMADQKSIVNFRETSRDMLAYWVADRIDQMAFLTMAGVSYAYRNNGVLRSSSDLSSLEFAADVTAPTAARRLQWTKSTGTLAPAGATNAVVAGDVPTYSLLVRLKAYAKTRYIRGVREAGGDETYHVFLTPLAMAQLRLDPEYQAILRSAGVRGDANALFAGTSSVKLDGMWIHEFRHVYNTNGAASGSKWGATGTVDGCSMLFCGAQALGMADLGTPEWVEKEFDYENQLGISVGKILGFKKPVFENIYEGGAAEDFGVINVYVSQQGTA